jgi:FtsH-binding integral membrane protein
LALLALPLWRGPARRTGWALWIGAAAVAVPALGLFVLRRGEPWWLAAGALLALLVATRVNHLSRLETAELFDACSSLPLAPARLRLARAALGLLAVLPGIVGVCAAALSLRATGLRVTVLAAWALACLGGCTVEVLSAPAEAATKAGRWLFTLVLCICLATEVLA